MILNAYLTSEAPLIFLSYGRADEGFCNTLATDLEQAGIDVWMDQRKIKPGQRWDDEIQKALREADTMLVVLSPASCESSNLRDEFSYALDQGDIIVPVLIKKCDIPFRLQRLQYIDFTGDYDTAYEHLLSRLTGAEIDIVDHELPRWKQLFARSNLILPAALSVIALLSLATMFLLKSNPSNVPLIELGSNRTLIDEDSDNTESLTLDPGPTLSDGTRIKSYHWELDGGIHTKSRVAHLELTPGLHDVLLAIRDENGRRHEDRMHISVLTTTQADQISMLLNVARQNIQLAEKDFSTALLTEGVSSAYGALQAALNIDPLNVEAEQQQQRIANIYAVEARNELEQHNYQEAADLINKGLQVDPEYSVLVELRAALER